jgi:hypothetical protein
MLKRVEMKRVETAGCAISLSISCLVLPLSTGSQGCSSTWRPFTACEGIASQNSVKHHEMSPMKHANVVNVNVTQGYSRILRVTAVLLISVKLLDLFEQGLWGLPLRLPWLERP